MRLSLLALSSALSLTFALPSDDAYSTDKTKSRRCQDYNIPLDITSTVNETTAAFPPFKDNLDVVNFAFNLARRDSRTAYVPLSMSQKNVTNSYTIAGTFCTPTNPTGNQSTVILATHGLGFDRRYWDIRKKAADYSFVDSAISRGYSVFFYDRLGTGKSTKVSGRDGAYASTQLAILTKLSTLIRAGKYTGSLGKPTKLAHIGHSFGSFLSNALIAQSPQLSDAALLTGLGFEPSGLGPGVESLALRIANDQRKFKDLSNEYLAPFDAPALAAFFLHAGSFEEELLKVAFDQAQPLSAIEFNTLSGLNLMAPKFTGPLMIIDGENDFPLCNGNCYGTLEGPASLLYPKATDVQLLIHPNVGHGINYSKNATGAYNVILDYLHKHDL